MQDIIRMIPARLVKDPRARGKADHVVQVFRVEIRTLNGVHPETLKGVIQKRYEVTDIQPLARTTLVHPA
jgi:hypothetical protein